MNLKISNIYTVGGFNRAKTIVKRVVPLPTAHTACNAVDTGGFLNLCSTYLYIHYTVFLCDGLQSYTKYEDKLLLIISLTTIEERDCCYSCKKTIDFFCLRGRFPSLP